MPHEPKFTRRPIDSRPEPSRPKSAEEWVNEAPAGGYYAKMLRGDRSSFDPTPSDAESFEAWLREVRNKRGLQNKTINARCRKLLEFMRKDPDPAVAPWAERLAIAIGVSKEPD